MENEIAVAICSLVGTLVGSLAGIMTANRLTNYRIEQLEEKVKKHNNLVERMIIVEQSTKSAHHRIDGYGTAYGLCETRTDRRVGSALLYRHVA